MLQITYSESDSKVAQQMQQDLTDAHLRVKQRILLVLVSPDALADEAVLESIQKAIHEKQALAPIILLDATLPETLRDAVSLDLRDGYKKNKVIQFVNQVDIGQERIKRNRRWLFYMSTVVLLVFIVSLTALASGFVAAPNDEFATDRARQDAQIETVVAPQLEAVRPRTTKDAENFPSTVEAAHESLQLWMIGTATAIPLDWSATDTARETVIAETSTAQANGD